jgi:hypothetical protein
VRYWRDTAPGPDPGGPAEPPPPKLLSNFSWPCRYICRKRKLRVGVGIWDLLTGGVRTVTVCLVCIVCAVCIVRTVIAVPILFQHFLKSHRSNPQRKHDECHVVKLADLLCQLVFKLSKEKDGTPAKKQIHTTSWNTAKDADS